MTRLKKLAVPAVIVCLTGAGGLWQQSARSSAELTPPPTEEPMIHALGVVDVEPGVAHLALTRTGRVVEVAVREGQVVEAGDVLVRLDDTQARAQLREAEAALAVAIHTWEAAQQVPAQHTAELAAQRSAIEAARVRLQMAEHVAEITRIALKEQRVGKVEYAAVDDEPAVAKARIHAEKAKLAALMASDPTIEVAKAAAMVAMHRAKVEQARDELAQLVLKAPARGIAIEVMARCGEASAGKPLVVFCPDGPRIVRVELDADVAPTVAPGCQVILTDLHGGNTSCLGKVIRLNAAYSQRRTNGHDALPFNDLRTLECIVEFEGHWPVRLNQQVQVRIKPSRASAQAE